MKMLVIGDEHTYGYGLPSGKLSYIGHFIRQIGRGGQAVSVEVYAHQTMDQIVATLAQLPLNRYDLIMLQLDHNLLQPWGTSINSLPCTTMPMLPYPVSHVSSKQSPPLLSRLKSLANGIGSLIRPLRNMALPILLKQLRPYRHNVLLLTPLPNRLSFSRWLQQRGRTLLLNEAEDQLFSVFDSDAVIGTGEEYFLVDDTKHLSAVSHELLGRSLFDFYQSAPTIVTVQSIRRLE